MQELTLTLFGFVVIVWLIGLAYFLAEEADPRTIIFRSLNVFSSMVSIRNLFHWWRLTPSGVPWWNFLVWNYAWCNQPSGPAMLFMASLAFIVYVDYSQYMIPRFCTLYAIPGWLVLAWLGLLPVDMLEVVVNMSLMLLLCVMLAAWGYFFNHQVMGQGDYEMLLMLTVCLGSEVWTVMLLACGLGILWGFVRSFIYPWWVSKWYSISKKNGQSNYLNCWSAQPVPFGSCLGLAAFLWVLYTHFWL